MQISVLWTLDSKVKGHLNQEKCISKRSLSFAMYVKDWFFCFKGQRLNFHRSIAEGKSKKSIDKDLRSRHKSVHLIQFISFQFMFQRSCFRIHRIKGSFTSNQLWKNNHNMSFFFQPKYYTDQQSHWKLIGV